MELFSMSTLAAALLTLLCGAIALYFVALKLGTPDEDPDITVEEVTDEEEDGGDQPTPEDLGKVPDTRPRSPSGDLLHSPRAKILVTKTPPGYADAVQLDEWTDPQSSLARGMTGPIKALNNTWNEPVWGTFRVRTKGYLTNGKKKMPSSGPPPFAPVGAMCFMKGDGKTESLMNCAQEIPSLKAHIESRPDSYFLVVGWACPGPPFRTVIFLFERREPVGTDAVFDKLFDGFINGTDDERKARFKYLPRLEVGPRAVLGGVKMLGGEKPAMLCNKIQPFYFKGPNYMEVDINISSSKTANMVSGLILPQVEKTVVAHAFILEGLNDEELPERVMCCLRIQGPALSASTGVVPTE